MTNEVTSDNQLRELVLENNIKLQALEELVEILKASVICVPGVSFAFNLHTKRMAERKAD